MAFTTASRITLGGTGGDVEGYFHIEDINLLMSQVGAEAVAVFNARVILSGDGSTVDCRVMLAVADIDPDLGSREFRKILDEPQHLVALPCPPFRDDNTVLRLDFVEVNPIP